MIFDTFNSVRDQFVVFSIDRTYYDNGGPLDGWPWPPNTLPDLSGLRDITQLPHVVGHGVDNVGVKLQVGDFPAQLSKRLPATPSHNIFQMLLDIVWMLGIM